MSSCFPTSLYGEVVNEPGANHPDLDDQTRSLAILAALVGCQGLDAFEMMLPVAYETGLTSVAIKEMIYQATAYCGFGRTLPFLKKLNVFLGAANVHLPLEPQGTTTSETRAQAGEDKQVEVFGENMRGFAQSGPEETRHINKWLADNCFGDYYTRGGLDTREREMVTLCFLAAQGGCEPQLTAHAKANMVVGNEKDVSNRGGLAVHAVYRVSAYAECDSLHQRCSGADARLIAVGFRSLQYERGCLPVTIGLDKQPLICFLQARYACAIITRPIRPWRRTARARSWPTAALR